MSGTTGARAMTTDDDLIRRSDAVKALSPMLRDMISRGHACRIVAAVPRADFSPPPEVVKELVEALRWYGEQARLARLIHSEGDAGRQSISDDGGKRARAVLAKLEGGE